MSRCVDADATELAVVKATTYGDALRAVREQPSIVIVRCGECKYWIDDRKSEVDMGTCGLTHYFTNTDDFCSYGERIDEYEKEYRELGLYELRELRQADERSRR